MDRKEEGVTLKDLLMAPIVLIVAAFSQLVTLLIIIVVGTIVYCVGGAILITLAEMIGNLLT